MGVRHGSTRWKSHHDSIIDQPTLSRRAVVIDEKMTHPPPSQQIARTIPLVRHTYFISVNCSPSRKWTQSDKILQFHQNPQSLYQVSFQGVLRCDDCWGDGGEPSRPSAKINSTIPTPSLVSWVLWFTFFLFILFGFYHGFYYDRTRRRRLGARCRTHSCAIGPSVCVFEPAPIEEARSCTTKVQLFRE